MSLSETASDILVKSLTDWGVDVIFGIPGDGINGIFEALRKQKDKIRFIQVRHEESAAFMACAYAKYTGKLGCCVATSGPGGIHLLNGLYDAKLDGQPVIAITGLQFQDLVHTFTQQDVELDKLYMDVSVYNSRIMSAAAVENMVDLACRAALSYKGVAHLTMPVDVQSHPASKEMLHSKRNIPRHTSDVYAHAMVLPDAAAIDQAVEVLKRGKRVAILAGRGANHATDELLDVAEKLGAPIIKAALGKACVPDDNPYCMGGNGLIGTLPAQEAMETCDTLLMVGTSFPYLEFMPKPGNAHCVQIDLDPMRIGLRYPIDVGLVGDSRLILRALSQLLPYKEDRSFFQEITKLKKEWEDRMRVQETREDKPMKPQVIASEMGRMLSDKAIVSADSGTSITWWMRHIHAKKGQKFSVSGNLASMACGLPYTIAAQVAFPDRQCVGLVGDGAFTMLMGEFVTAVKYNLPIKIVVLKNNTLGQIKWEQMVFLGNPEYGVELEPIDFVGIAKACGGEGYRIEDPKECGEVLGKAFANGKPTVIEAVVDALEPPMPAKVKPEQAAHFAESLARGEPYAGKIALTALSDKVREVI